MPAIKAAGGRFIVAGVPEVREFGIAERIVVIEFPSFDAAKACYDDNEEYKKALEVVGDGYERDLRIVEGLEED